MRRKPFVQGKRFYLDGRRKQKGGFFIGPALEFGVSLVKKLLGGRRKRRKRRRRWLGLGIILLW